MDEDFRREEVDSRRRGDAGNMVDQIYIRVSSTGMDAF